MAGGRLAFFQVRWSSLRDKSRLDDVRFSSSGVKVHGLWSRSSFGPQWG